MGKTCKLSVHETALLLVSRGHYWCSTRGISSGSRLVAFSLMSLRVKAQCPLGLHVIGWRGLGIWVNFPTIMEISRAPETNRQETGRKYLNLHWPFVGTFPHSQPAHAYLNIHTHWSVHLDCVAVTIGPWVCSLSGSAWVRARVQRTTAWALHHSASWLDRPWLWGPSRSCWVHSNCALLRKGFSILLMDYSPTSPVWVDSFDWQTHTGMQMCTLASWEGLHDLKK